jgi:putative transcriptional regulator
MNKTRAYKSDVSASIHEIASGLHKVGMIDKKTRRHFDESCLTSIREFSSGDPQAT